ncbi:NAD-dependent epimerase dehydratase [Fusarium subglutinans]|uniref:NAD-dependent epimerase dehydratase n=1 Tax=Gibberella subglutinans TaxID=42677 RepID=A0A8H5PDE7_GIBSU|nr:NAD-dependent epimerase dehydratase [Fusarium subglutinans]KAF5594383.1 NAD-dependent epimerase dehydratase [Fusarium subglutinans]
MSRLPVQRILLTGATGYVGGTVLDHLVKAQDEVLKALTIDLLIRSDDAAAKLRSTYGDRVNPIQWAGLHDVDYIRDIASNYELIINTGSGFIPDGAEAFVRGLARRVEPGVPPPWLLHISGCSNLADRPLTQKAYPDREWNDTDGNSVYEFLKSEDAREPYLQRTTEVRVLTTAEETGVQAVSLNTPVIFGAGKGLFNQQGIIIPIIMRYVIQHGHGFKLNETANWDWVHVEDLADAFVLLTRTILEREDRGVGHIPTGKNGILFPAVGRALQTEIMQRCLDAAFDEGILPREDTPPSKEIRDVTLQELADEITAGLVDMAERGWAGTKSMKGTELKRLAGWNPSRLEDAWKQDFKDELEALKNGKRPWTLESCIGKAG